MPAPCGPLHVVQRLYADMGHPSADGALGQGVRAHYASALKDPAARAQVPVLGRDAGIPEGSLVQFRGMVVDMEDPEYYFGCVRYKDGHSVTTKYGGASAMRGDEEPAESKVWERRPLRCVPVPGERSWASPTGADAAAGGGSCTVYMYDQEGQGVMLHHVITAVGVYTKGPSQAEQASCMRAAEEGFEAEPAAKGSLDTTPALQVHAILLEGEADASQGEQAQGPEAPAAGVAPDRVLPCRAAALQLLQHALGGDALGAELLLLSLLSQATSKAQPGQRAPGSTALNLVLPPETDLSASSTAALAAPPAPAASPASAAASAAPAGQASCVGASVAAALGALAPRVSCLPLSVAQCNAGRWCPRRDYDTNRLSRSPLQLARGTVLLVDETVMGEGRLSEEGVGSLQALLTLVQEQALLYDFQFYKQPVPMSVTPVVVSKGRSVLHEALPLKLHLQPSQQLPSAAQVDVLAASLGEALLAESRAFLAAARQQPYELSEEMVKQLQDEFVAARKGDRTFSPDHFHTRLTLARLAALSFGEGGLSPQRWRYALDLEARMAARAARK